MVLTQSKIHLYGLNPKKHFVTSRFASEALHSDTMRLHLGGLAHATQCDGEALREHILFAVARDRRVDRPSAGCSRQGLGQAEVHPIRACRLDHHGSGRWRLAAPMRFSIMFLAHLSCLEAEDCGLLGLLGETQ